MTQTRFDLNIFLAMAASLLAGGCQLTWPTGHLAQTVSDSTLAVQEAKVVASTDQSPSTSPAESHEPNDVDAPKTQDQAMAEVLDELQQIGAIDQKAQQELLADLRNAKPEHWSLIVEQFQSALAYRQQLAARESQSTPGNVTQVSSEAPASVYTPKENGASEPSATAVHATQETPKANAGAARNAQLSRKALPAKSSLEPTQTLPPAPTDSHRDATALAVPHRPAVEQASYEQASPLSPAIKANSWQKHLQTTIHALEQSAQQAPASIEEVHQHMRLRILHLLAGQEDDALRPMPGATTTQQDYWSKQLFAISTFLDSAGQPDDKRRATGSLMHLDSARASLAELATLQIRNLTLVDSVDGFGVYQARKKTKFRPAEQVTLYTEVENFRSESTKDGYRTALSTSYEVLDQNGQRVDGAQFPDVEDLCKNKRRDFHMQYGVALPTRIYPGQYKLQLTITDQLSHKIGQMSVPFEIVE